MAHGERRRWPDVVLFSSFLCKTKKSLIVWQSDSFYSLSVEFFVLDARQGMVSGKTLSGACIKCLVQAGINGLFARADLVPDDATNCCTTDGAQRATAS